MRKEEDFSWVMFGKVSLLLDVTWQLAPGPLEIWLGMSIAILLVIQLLNVLFFLQRNLSQTSKGTYVLGFSV